MTMIGDVTDRKEEHAMIDTALTYRWHRDKHTILPHIPEGSEAEVHGNIDGNKYTLTGTVYYGGTPGTPWVGGQSLRNSETGKPWFDIITITWRIG